jgi:sigma-B regulation protein RsbU (phosphoserine phosphatase)
VWADPAIEGNRFGEAALLALGTGQAPTNASGIISVLIELLDSFGDGLVDDTALLALSVPAVESQFLSPALGSEN